MENSWDHGFKLKLCLKNEYHTRSTVVSALPCNERGLTKTIQTIPHGLYVRIPFKSLQTKCGTMEFRRFQKEFLSFYKGSCTFKPLQNYAKHLEFHEEQSSYEGKKIEFCFFGKIEFPSRSAKKPVID